MTLRTPAQRLQQLYLMRQQDRGIRTIRREVTQLQRRPGTSLAPLGNFALKDHGVHPVTIGDGFCYDYAIDLNWTGPQGQERPTSTGSTYRTYSSVKPAFDDANANRQAVGQSSSFFICGGLYSESTTISLDPPISGSYVVRGAGRDVVTILGTMGSGDLFDIPTQAVDSIVTIDEVELNGGTDPLTLVNGGGSTRIALGHIWFRVNDPNAICVNPGIQGVGVQVHDFLMEGAGKGIAAAGGFSEIYLGIQLANGRINLTRGIELDNDGAVHASNVEFTCSGEDVYITNFGGLVASFNGCEFNKGIIFDDPTLAVAFDHFVVAGSIFILSGSEKAVDFSTGTNAAGCQAFIFIGNVVKGVSGTIGVRGLNAGTGGPTHSIVVGNSFIGLDAGDEIVDMDQTGNIVAHNTTDSGVVLPVLPVNQLNSITKHQTHALGVR